MTGIYKPTMYFFAEWFLPPIYGDFFGGWFMALFETHYEVSYPVTHTD